MKVTELRYEGNKFRLFTVCVANGSPDQRTVRLAWGTIEQRGGVPEFVQGWGAAAIMSVPYTEKWHHDISRADARAKLEAWRKSCARAGLNRATTFNS